MKLIVLLAIGVSKLIVQKVGVLFSKEIKCLLERLFIVTGDQPSSNWGLVQAIFYQFYNYYLVC